MHRSTCVLLIVLIFEILTPGAAGAEYPPVSMDPVMQSADIHDLIRKHDINAVRRMLTANPECIRQTAAQTGSYPLHTAVLARNNEIVRLLIDTGADANAGNLYGWTPLHFSIMTKQTDMSALLIEKGADVNAVSILGRQTPMHLMVLHGTPAGAADLLAAGADPDGSDENGVTPFLKAAASGKLEMARFLAGHGADVRACDSGGKNALHSAVYNDDRPLITWLCGLEIDIDATDGRGWTPLHCAAAWGYLDLVKLFVDKGADAAVPDVSGRSPLDDARRYGHAGIAAFLADIGALEANNWNEETPVRPLSILPGQALIRYLGHSGWAVETANHLLIFDYHEDRPRPAYSGLVNGFIDPAGIAGRRVTVFASHLHTDHLDSTIFSWRGKIESLRYVFGWNGGGDSTDTRLGPRRHVVWDDMEIRCIHSPEAGEIDGNFLVMVDGLVLYHSGDYSRSTDCFKKDMEYLSSITGGIDLFFINAGNSMDNREAQTALEIVRPDHVFPMHQGGNEQRLITFRETIERVHPSMQVHIAFTRGDAFLYRQGMVRPLHN